MATIGCSLESNWATFKMTVVVGGYGSAGVGGRGNLHFFPLNTRIQGQKRVQRFTKCLLWTVRWLRNIPAPLWDEGGDAQMDYRVQTGYILPIDVDQQALAAGHIRLPWKQ